MGMYALVIFITPGQPPMLVMTTQSVNLPEDFRARIPS
jgi:hypothetical protein